jgi:hypothetical protein
MIRGVQACGGSSKIGEPESAASDVVPSGWACTCLEQALSRRSSPFDHHYPARARWQYGTAKDRYAAIQRWAICCVCACVQARVRVRHMIAVREHQYVVLRCWAANVHKLPESAADVPTRNQPARAAAGRSVNCISSVTGATTRLAARACGGGKCKCGSAA